MNIQVAREVAARIWCDPKMEDRVMDADLAEEIAQLLSSRLTKRAADLLCCCAEIETASVVNPDCPRHGAMRANR